MLRTLAVPTPLTHAVLGLAAVEALPVERAAKNRLRVLAVACATVADLDAIGFFFGIRYGDLWGHRGLTHSLSFALVLAVIAAAVGFSGSGLRRRSSLAAFFFVLGASHGLLDAMTNGGLGIAFFSPFDPTRHFLAWRPIVVAPLSIAGILSERGARLMISEITIVWLPAFVGLALMTGWRRVRRRSQQLTDAVAAVEARDGEGPTGLNVRQSSKRP